VTDEPDSPSSLSNFAPVPLRPRHDGWTPDKQVAFLEALAETACVHEACRRVGMSDVSAYALRRREDAQAFRDAWDSALDYALHRLEQAAIGRALNGVARPIFHKGEQIGEWREYDERLTMFLLRTRRANRYGAWIDRIVPFDDPEQLDNSAGRLAWHCFEIHEFERDEDAQSPRTVEE